MMMNIKQLGLGCMSMCRKNAEKSTRTIHYALDAGINFFNTGEFYRAGESEIIVGEALKNIPRDKYFLSVKFGVLPAPDGSIYGLDVNPFNIKAHLTYSLKRLGLDYVDLYQPARMDLAYPVEEIVGEMSKLVDAGYIKNIGLTQIDEETLRRANKIHKIHTVELRYSLAEREYEKNNLINVAKELGINILLFGVLAHGLFNDNIFDGKVNHSLPSGFLAEENFSENLKLLRELKKVADKKSTTLSKLATAYAFAKFPFASSLIGTTSAEHLQEAIDALEINLSAADIEEIEKAFPEEKLRGQGMPKFICKNGKLVR